MLDNLKALNLSDNALESLPPAIANLKHLKSLMLHKNRLRTLPIEIISLKCLSEVNTNLKQETFLHIIYVKKNIPFMAFFGLIFIYIRLYNTYNINICIHTGHGKQSRSLNNQLSEYIMLNHYNGKFSLRNIFLISVRISFVFRLTKCRAMREGMVWTASRGLRIQINIINLYIYIFFFYLFYK